MSKEIKNKIVPKLRFPEFKDDGDWEEKTLGTECKSFSGGTPSTTQKKFYGGGIPFIRSAEINKETTELFITEEGLINSSARLVNAGDILVALYGANSGDVSLARIDGAINQAILCLKSSQNNSFIYQFLLFKKSWIVSTYIQGGQGNLSGDIIKKIKLAFPTKEEQQKIASCLSSLDELITAQSKKLEALKSHKKGLMQQLFPAEGETVPKLRFPEFKVSGEWEEKKLGEISDVRDGTHDSPKFVLEGKRLLTSKNLLSTGQLDFENTSLISQIDYEQINKRSKVDVGDILFGMIGTIGNPVIVKIDGFAIKNVALIKQKKELLNNYLIHFLDSDYINGKFSFLLKGNAQKFIALGVIRNINICIPNLNEQQKIASCLSSLDEIITAQAEKIESLKEHKKGLMQGLFPSEL